MLKIPVWLRVLGFLFLASLIAGAIASGQVPSSTVVLENIYLAPLEATDWETETNKAGHKPIACPPYFVIPSGVLYPGKGKAALVLFKSLSGTYQFEYEPWGVDRNEFFVMLENRERPMVSFIGPLDPSDPIRRHVLLRISPEDFETAKPCVPEKNFWPQPPPATE